MISPREKSRPPRREPGSTRDRATQAEQQLPVEQHDEDALCTESHSGRTPSSAPTNNNPAPAGTPFELTDNETSSATSQNDDAPVRAGTLFTRIAGDFTFTGSPRDLLARCRFQAALYSGRSRWQRRLVQTIRFEDAQTLRRTTSIDISGDFLTRLLEHYRFDRNEIYLPVLTGMVPGPILDIDANDGSHHRLNVARRHENNEAITYQLTGLALYREAGADRLDAPMWAECLATAIYRFLSTPSRDRGALEGDIKRIPDVPENVREFIASDSFLDEVTNQRNYYTLHITYRPSRDDVEAVQDDVLKISWLEGYANPPAAGHPLMLTLKSLVRFLSPVPKAYAIDTPILDNSGASGATHVRIITPEDSTVGRIALSRAGVEFSLLPRPGSRSQSDTLAPYRTFFCSCRRSHRPDSWGHLHLPTGRSSGSLERAHPFVKFLDIHTKLLDINTRNDPNMDHQCESESGSKEIPRTRVRESVAVARPDRDRASPPAVHITPGRGIHYTGTATNTGVRHIRRSHRADQIEPEHNLLPVKHSLTRHAIFRGTPRACPGRRRPSVRSYHHHRFRDNRVPLHHTRTPARTRRRT